MGILISAAAVSAGCDYLALIDIENRSSVPILVDPQADDPFVLQPGEEKEGVNGRINRDTTLTVTNTEDPADVQTTKFDERARPKVVVTGPPLVLTVED